MYSVGEELTKAQTADIFGQYAQDEKISRDGYLEVCISVVVVMKNEFSITNVLTVRGYEILIIL
jgi:hypothetical protein